MEFDGEIDAEDVLLQLKGSGGLRVEHVVARRLVIDASSSGSLTVRSGSAAKAMIDHTGSGSVDAEGVLAKKCFVHHRGSGSVSVHAIDAIVGEASGSGSVRYGGDPSVVDLRSTGSGGVKHLRHR